MEGCYSIVKAHLISVTANGQFAKVQSLGKVFNQVPFLYPYGYFASIKGGDDDSMCLLLKVMDRDDILYALPYKPTSQPITLVEDEVTMGNFNIGSSVTFKANGDVDVLAPGNVNITATGNTVVTSTGTVTVSGSAVTLGDGLGTVLNSLAVITSPAGTAGGPCVITSPGQTKVLA